ncbi:MAG: UDP diphosphate synthase, partial [Methanotrichaceae archaeon]|nr:UDP diphosphate synthase [Methanotrichaceae archaeon]
MLHYLYERFLERQISKGPLPKCLAIILSSSDLDKEGLKLIRDLCNWSESLGLSSLIFSINEDTPETREKIVMLLRDAPADICLHTEDGLKSIGAGGSFRIIVSLGFGGKREVTEAFRKLLKDVENGRLNPEDIDEKSIEKNLRFG